MKPSIPKGTRDFSPTEMVRRNFIFKTIREVFEKYGYQPIETPAMENLETLMGKYGEEGDKLIFKILNSGNYTDFQLEVKELKKKYDRLTPGAPYCLLTDIFPTNDLTKKISEKALRYDLTVPFARYVVQHQNEITFPFKRYQMQPVWRADKPQKGRYREFFQCDADVIGSNSLLNEVELMQMIDEVYKALSIPVIIKFNNRKILNGILAIANIPLNHINNILNAIDDFDKDGRDFAMHKLKEKGIGEENIQKLKDIIYPLMDVVDPKIDLTEKLEEIFENRTEIGVEGIKQVKFLLDTIRSIFGEKNVVYKSGLLSKYPRTESWEQKEESKAIYLHFDISLARGLNYYTGSIFEVKVDSQRCKSEFTSSICGGGRYDDLTGIFGLNSISGVGISFGIDRIFDVMNELNLFEKLNLAASTTKVMLAHFGEAERNYCINVASQLRAAGINTEIYPDITKKISKQFDYANKKQIPFVIVVGGDEMKTGELALKNMATGEQTKLKVQEIIGKLK